MVEYSGMHAVIVDWYGPFAEPDEAIKWIRENPGRVPGSNSVPANASGSDHRKPTGIYFAIGTVDPTKLRRWWRGYFQQARVQYVGVGNVVARLLKRKHPIRFMLGRCEQVWVGSLATFPSRDDVPPIGDPKHDNQIEQAEALLAYFLEAPLNQKKREHKTPAPGVLVNRWFTVVNGRPQPFGSSPHPSVPDILIFPYDGPRSQDLVPPRARDVILSPLAPNWLEHSMAKAALIRFEARSNAGPRTTIRLVDALKAKQFDNTLLRRPDRSRRKPQQVGNRGKPVPV